MASIIPEVMSKMMAQKATAGKPQPMPSATLSQAARGARFTSTTRRGNNTGELKWDNMDRKKDSFQSGAQFDKKNQNKDQQQQDLHKNTSDQFQNKNSQFQNKDENQTQWQRDNKQDKNQDRNEDKHQNRFSKDDKYQDQWQKNQSEFLKQDKSQDKSQSQNKNMNQFQNKDNQNQFQNKDNKDKNQNQFETQNKDQSQWLNKDNQNQDKHQNQWMSQDKNQNQDKKADGWWNQDTFQKKTDQDKNFNQFQSKDNQNQFESKDSKDKSFNQFENKDNQNQFQNKDNKNQWMNQDKNQNKDNQFQNKDKNSNLFENKDNKNQWMSQDKNQDKSQDKSLNQFNQYNPFNQPKDTSLNQFNQDKNMKTDKDINDNNMNVTSMAQDQMNKEVKNLTDKMTDQVSAATSHLFSTSNDNDNKKEGQDAGLLHDVKEVGKKTAQFVYDKAKEATQYFTGNKGYEEADNLMEKGKQGAQNLKEGGKETAEMLTGHKGVKENSNVYANAGSDAGGWSGGEFNAAGGASHGADVKHKVGGDRSQDTTTRMQGPQKMEGKIGGVEGEGNWGRPQTHPNMPNDPYAQGTQGAKQEMSELKGADKKDSDAKQEPQGFMKGYLKEKAKETPDDTREVFEFQKGERGFNENQVKVADYLKEEVGHKPPTEQPTNWAHQRNWNEDRKDMNKSDKL